jgi:hypothetical protein
MPPEAQTTIATEADLPIDEFVSRGNARDRGEEVPELAPVEEKKPAAPKPETVEVPEVEIKPDDAEKARKEKPQDRIDRAVAKQREAERRAEDAERRLAEATRKAEPAAPAATDTDPEPKIEDFLKLSDGSDNPDPYSSHMRAVAKWEGRQEVRRAMQANAQAAAQRAFDEAETARQKAFGEKIKAAIEKDKDFATRVSVNVDWDKVQPASSLDPKSRPTAINAIADYLVDADDPASLMAHLDAHYDEFQRLLTLHPFQVAGQMGRLEGRLGTAKPGPGPKPIPVSHAKPPIKPVGSSPVVGDDADDEADLPVDEFIRRGNARDRRLAAR